MTPSTIELTPYLENALKAEVLFRRDRGLYRQAMVR